MLLDFGAGWMVIALSPTLSQKGEGIMVGQGWDEGMLFRIIQGMPVGVRILLILQELKC